MYDSGDIGCYQIDSELVLGPSQGRPSMEGQVQDGMQRKEGGLTAIVSCPPDRSAAWSSVS